MLEFVDHLSGSIGRQPLQADGRTCDERHRRSRRWQQAVLDEPAHHAADDAMQKFLQMLTVRRINLMETRSVALQRIDPVQDDHVQVDVKVQRTAKALNEGHHASPGPGCTG